MDNRSNYKETLIYSNPLKCKEDIKDFILEGKAEISFINESMRMENALSNELGQKANYVLWCNETFPENIKVSWEFKPLTDIGLCILFFSAMGKNGKDLFDPSLNKRTGEYPQYHSGDMDAFHVSYFRRKEVDERAFHTCNLRKSYGFHLVAQGADPIPSANDAIDYYRISLTKYNNIITFLINDLVIFTYADDGVSYGDFLKGGRIGFRQLAPLVAEYKNLKVYQLS